jgi:hypothetical protein
VLPILPSWLQKDLLFSIMISPSSISPEDFCAAMSLFGHLTVALTLTCNAQVGGFPSCRKCVYDGRVQRDSGSPGKLASELGPHPFW